MLQGRPTQAMAPKQDEEQNRQNIATDGQPCSSSRFISEVTLVAPGDPQPDDKVKMEKISADVSVEFANLWGADGIPPGGYPAGDPLRAQLHWSLRAALWKEADINTRQKLRIWDLMQDEYNL